MYKIKRRRGSKNRILGRTTLIRGGWVQKSYTRTDPQFLSLKTEYSAIVVNSKMLEINFQVSQFTINSIRRHLQFCSIITSEMTK